MDIANEALITAQEKVFSTETQFNRSGLYLNITSKFSNGTRENATRDPTTSAEFMATKVLFYFVILSCSTVGNALVACIICSRKKMRTPSNYLILNLSICDLITPLVSIPFDFALEENGYSWMYGGFMCKILWPFATLTTTSSSLTLAAISLDRYRIIMHPFKSRLSSKQVKIIIAAVHITSLIVVSPYVHSLHLKGEYCSEDWPEISYRQGYTVSLFLIQYGIPLLYMIVMYTLAVTNLRLASSRMRNNSINATSNTVPSKKKVKVSWNSPNARATKMFMIVVLVFAVFMFPNQVVWLWADFGGGFNHQHFQMASIICWLFTYTNSVCNPLIYFMFSKDFRSGFKKMFRKMTCWKKSWTLDKNLSSYRTGTESSHSAGKPGDNSHVDVKQDRYATNEFRKGFHKDKSLDNNTTIITSCYSTLDDDRAEMPIERIIEKNCENRNELSSSRSKHVDYNNCFILAEHLDSHDVSVFISQDILDDIQCLPETNC